jgi:AraC-like DNA-binding protein
MCKAERARARNRDPRRGGVRREVASTPLDAGSESCFGCRAGMAIGPLYRCFIEVARERGVDVARLLADFGLSEATLVDPATRLSPELGRALGQALMERTGDSEIGLRAAAHFRLADLDLLGYLARNSDDLFAMFQALAQYARLLGDTAACTVERKQDVVSIRLGRSGGRHLLPGVSDFAAGVVARLVRELSRGAARPLLVELPRPRPRRPERYVRFFEAPVRFGTEEAALSFPATALSEPALDGDARLGAILRRQADQQLASLPPDAGLVERVRALLLAELEQGPGDLAQLAAQLCMSERSLRRHLSASGTGYRQLLDEVRRERALELAHEAELSVTSLAMKAGFGDATAFARAFRRWTGVLPGEYLSTVRAQKVG